jgi:protein KRI1
MAEQFNDEYYNQDDDIMKPEEMINDKYDQYLADEDHEDTQDDHTPNQMTYRNIKDKKDSLLDELYQFDYEDIVAGIPCRFKYRSVPAEDYGLTVEDIIEADESELNRYVSLKRIAPYYSGLQLDKAKLSKKRKRLRAAIKEKKAVDETSFSGTKNNHSKESEQESGSIINDSNAITSENNEKRKRKRRKQKRSAAETVPVEIMAPNNGSIKDKSNNSSSKRELKMKKVKKNETEDLKKYEINHRMSLYK